MNSSFFINVLLFYFYFHYTEAAIPGGFVEVTMTTGEAMNTTSDFADFSSIQVKKINRKHVVVGEFVFKNGLSNDQDCTLLLFKKQGGEYRKTSFKLPIKGCCDFYNTDTYIIPEIQARCPKCPKQSDNVCPIPADSYMIDKYEYDAKNLPPNFDGDYKAEFLVTKNGELLAGYSFLVKIIR